MSLRISATSRPRFMIPMRVPVCLAWNRSCVVVRLDGEDEAQALQALVDLFERRFDEDS